MKNKRRIKAVVFDLGDTLIKTKKKYRVLFTRRYSLHLSREHYGNIFNKVFHSRSWKNIEHAFLDFVRQCGRPHHDKFISDIREMWNEQHQNHVVFKAAKPLLKELRKEDYKVALLSNATQRCREILDFHRLTPYFHVIGVSAERKVCKPDIRFFHYVLRHLQVKPRETLMVGDNYEKDYLPAKKLGMHALLLERGKRKYHHSIRSLRQVKTYLKKING